LNLPVCRNKESGAHARIRREECKQKASEFGDFKNYEAKRPRFRIAGQTDQANLMNIGLYIHIPFCQRRCNYCHFISRPWDEDLEARYFQAILKEISAYADENTLNMDVVSIYFGGGTPSLMPAQHLAEILAYCRRIFTVVSDCEITLEANPGTVSGAKAESYQAMGVNRVSIGAQSFAESELASISRIHNAGDVEEAIATFRSRGIENLNVDLMLGLPGQSAASWQMNLDRIVQLAPTHLSVYMLDLDDKTPLYHEIKEGRYQIPDDDQISDWYLETIHFLSQYGYDQYEISNFARKGFCCRHNLKYWLCEPVIGFGLGSHSYDGVARYANCSLMEEYLQRVESGLPAVEWRRELNNLQKLQEILFLGLRLNRGVNPDCLKMRFGSELFSRYAAVITTMRDYGLMEIRESQLRLTTRGMLLSNEVFQQFV
jgi:oxygen-independent coproporphyrinogen III oxidase